MPKLTLALDWTPNINHIGFLVAQDKGFYTSREIDLNIINPAEDNYQVTPAKKVELGQADFALCPTESILSYRTKENPFGMKAVAAIYKEDLSAIVVMADQGINSPKDLDGRTYASYQARYEDEIVRQMIRNDGGRGDITITHPEKLGIWNTILQKEIDATWIFVNWEGLQAQAEGIELQLFRMREYGIPYSYSPVLAVDEEKIKTHGESYRAFLQASREGFLFAQEHPQEAVTILARQVPAHDQNIDLNKALALSSPHFGEQSGWGKIDAGEVKAYLDWIYQHGLESRKLQPSDLFTNELLS